MIRRRVSLIVLAVLAVFLGVAVAGTPDTGQSPRINDVNPTQDTPAPVIDTLARPNEVPGQDTGELPALTTTTEAHRTTTTEKP